MHEGVPINDVVLDPLHLEERVRQLPQRVILDVDVLLRLLLLSFLLLCYLRFGHLLSASFRFDLLLLELFVHDNLFQGGELSEDRQLLFLHQF